MYAVYAFNCLLTEYIIIYCNEFTFEDVFFANIFLQFFAKLADLQLDLADFNQIFHTYNLSKLVKSCIFVRSQFNVLFHFNTIDPWLT